MNLASRDDLLGSDSRTLSDFRDLLLCLCVSFTDQSPLGRLERGKDVPAKKVKEHLEHITRIGFSSVIEEKDRIEAFAAYIDRQIEAEKIEAALRKAARHAKQAGITHQRIQSIFLRVLDRVFD